MSGNIVQQHHITTLRALRHTSNLTWDVRLIPTIFQNSPLLTRPAVVLPHLVTGWHVDQAIMSEEERLVIIRFGRDWDPDCMRQDEVLYRESALFPESAPVVCADLL